MQEQTQLNHPERFNIPSVHSIKSVINAVLRQHMKTAQNVQLNTAVAEAQAGETNGATNRPRDTQMEGGQKL